MNIHVDLHVLTKNSIYVRADLHVFTRNSSCVHVELHVSLRRIEEEGYLLVRMSRILSYNNIIIVCIRTHRLFKYTGKYKLNMYMYIMPSKSLKVECRGSMKLPWPTNFII